MDQATNKDAGATIEFERGDKTYSAQLAPLNIQGETKQILVVEIDITQEALIVKQMQRTLAKEREVNDLKSRFTSIVSHEFRTPLHSISSSATLIEKYPQENQQSQRSKHVKRIIKSVDDLISILNRILVLSQVEDNPDQQNFINSPVEQVLNEVIDDAIAANLQCPRIVKNINGNPEFISDPIIVKNIASNLLSNAIKYTHSEGEIHIDASCTNNILTISFTDNGLGIPEKDQHKLFEQFYRADNVANIEGSGLGLNIVKRYLDIVEGTIEFTSQPNIQTCFTVSIPEKAKHHKYEDDFAH